MVGSCSRSRDECRTIMSSCSAGHDRSSAISAHRSCGWESSRRAPERLTTAAIASTMQAIPHARIEMRRLGFFDVASDLESGRVDVVFAPAPMRLPPRIRIEPLWLEPRVLVVPADHALAGRESVSIGETNDEVFVAVAGGVPEVVDWWLVDPRPDGSRPRRGPTADSVDGLFELVAAGAGVNIAGQSASRQYRRDELAFVPISDIEPATIVLCSLSDSPNPMVKTFRETAQALSPLVDATFH